MSIVPISKDQYFSPLLLSSICCFYVFVPPPDSQRAIFFKTCDWHAMLYLTESNTEQERHMKMCKSCP